MTVNDLLTEAERELLAQHWPEWSDFHEQWMCEQYQWELFGSRRCHEWPCETATLMLAMVDARRELAAVRQQLADAANEINCAGPVAGRIRVLRAELTARAEKAEAELDRVRKALICEASRCARGAHLQALHKLEELCRGKRAVSTRRLSQAIDAAQESARLIAIELRDAYDHTHTAREVEE